MWVYTFIYMMLCLIVGKLMCEREGRRKKGEGRKGWRKELGRKGGRGKTAQDGSCCSLGSLRQLQESRLDLLPTSGTLSGTCPSAGFSVPESPLGT